MKTYDKLYNSVKKMSTTEIVDLYVYSLAMLEVLLRGKNGKKTQDCKDIILVLSTVLGDRLCSNQLPSVYLQ